MAHIDDLREKLAYLEESEALAGAAADVRAAVAAEEAATGGSKKRTPKPAAADNPKET